MEEVVEEGRNNLRHGLSIPDHNCTMRSAL